MPKENAVPLTVLSAPSQPWTHHRAVAKATSHQQRPDRGSETCVLPGKRLKMSAMNRKLIYSATETVSKHVEHCEYPLKSLFQDFLELFSNFWVCAVSIVVASGDTAVARVDKSHTVIETDFVLGPSQ